MAAPTDPFSAYNFIVEVEAIELGGFTSVSGLQSRAEPRTVREGGVNATEYKLPGQITFTDLTLEAGLTVRDAMWTWYRATLEGAVQRKNGTIYLMNGRRQPAISWNFYNAWPVEWVGPTLDAGQTLVATQRFVLAHEGLVRSNPA